jgi:hypothetical protein
MESQRHEVVRGQAGLGPAPVLPLQGVNRAVSDPAVARVARPDGETVGRLVELATDEGVDEGQRRGGDLDELGAARKVVLGARVAAEVYVTGEGENGTSRSEERVGQVRRTGRSSRGSDRRTWTRTIPPAR